MRKVKAMRGLALAIGAVLILAGGAMGGALAAGSAGEPGSR